LIIEIRDREIDALDRTRPARRGKARRHRRHRCRRPRIPRPHPVSHLTCSNFCNAIPRHFRSRRSAATSPY
jgi:hypothetical protein